MEWVGLGLTGSPEKKMQREIFRFRNMASSLVLCDKNDIF